MISDRARKTISTLFPRLYGKYILEKVYRYSHFRRLHIKRLSEIKTRGYARVLFVLSSFSMWRLEDICSLLLEDNRFDVHFVICPFQELEDTQKTIYTNELADYCDKKGWRFTTKAQFEGNLVDTLDPDIIFYPQLYHDLFGNELDCEQNLDRLIAYVPYGFPTVSGEWMYNSRFMNNAWLLFFPTSLHLDFYRKHSYIKGINMVVVGDSHAQAFLDNSGTYNWKKQDREKKRIIWAPHFSICEGGHLHRGSFLWLHQHMLDIAKRYEDHIQFVFKPHPWLLTKLYEHPEWGQQRSDEYYDAWRNGSNTQIETGAYVDLFCSSDALIHDCGSFTAEYLYTGEPVLFVSKDFAPIYDGLDAFGKQCMDLHYHAKSIDEVYAFIDRIVIQGEDEMKQFRKNFRERILIPKEGSPFGKSVYNEIVNALFS